MLCCTMVTSKKVIINPNGLTDNWMLPRSCYVFSTQQRQTITYTVWDYLCERRWVVAQLKFQNRNLQKNHDESVFFTVAKLGIPHVHLEYIFAFLQAPFCISQAKHKTLSCRWRPLKSVGSSPQGQIHRQSYRHSYFPFKHLLILSADELKVTAACTFLALFRKLKASDELWCVFQSFRSTLRT